ncbi:EAL domain-containing protein [Herbaspirillum lusitanum]|jgi:diguanylate cyclase (GGDEF)-like protein/PAS domain S-box-containing protein|uniref:EAL domain-containing protein n=1 Tax=Herbaspirillum lusitanum TaxID=213312 RepID=A0ABW9A5K0_9BURK
MSHEEARGPAELAALSTELSYKLLVEGVSDYAIYLLNPDGIVSSWNTGAQLAKGYRADEIIGQHFSLFYTAGDRVKGLPQQALQQALTSGKFEAEGWRLRKNGGRFWAHVVIDPIYKEDGRLLGFAKITRDCTEQRRLQDASLESERNFRLLVEGVTDYAIYMLKPDGTVANWNSGAQRAKGYSKNEIVGRHFSVFYTEEERADGLPQRALETALREGRFEIYGWRLRKDGSRFWAHAVIDPIYHDDGALLGFAKITRDCSAQKKLEEERRDTENRFRLLVEGITDYAIYMLNPDGTVANWNAGAQRAKGYLAKEIVGRHFSDFYLAEERDAGLPQANLNTSLATGKFEGEGWRLRKDGSRFWAHVVIDPIYREDGVLLGFAKITRDRTEQNESAAKIMFLARHDGLTGLPNRAQFMEQLDTSLAACADTSHRVATISIDLDGFKEINDAFGHAIGDQVLCKLAERLKKLVGEHEFVARFGGDEFVAMKYYKSDKALRDFITRLHKALTTTLHLEDTDMTPGASIGVAIFPLDAQERAQLLNNSDLAMYRAKKSIGEKICFYESEMDEASRMRRTMARDIWVALEQGQFFLNYQVQRAVNPDRVTGYEVLLRWRHPELGLISPAVFIPVAEECGAIGAIGDWVLENACREAMQWNLQPKIAVNLSPLQLNNVSMIDRVRNVLAETGLPAERLELEVTESALVGDKARALHILQEIKAMGATIAIDDFGSGYSSLETLRSFPFDKIKLDRSFISELETSRQAKAFVRAILALGHSLNVSVLAEGVETEQQLAVLQQEGCHQMQGFLFGRPETLAILAETRSLQAIDLAPDAVATTLLAQPQQGLADGRP